MTFVFTFSIIIRRRAIIECALVLFRKKNNRNTFKLFEEHNSFGGGAQTNTILYRVIGFIARWECTLLNSEI